MNKAISKSPLTVDDLKLGDIIKIRAYYGPDHYGIYVGDKKIVHNKPGTNLMMDGPGGGVTLSNFEDYLKMGDGSWMLVSKPCLMHLNKPCDCSEEHKQHSEELTAERALQRVGETRFHLRTNNSETFVMECKFGVSESSQFRNSILNGIASGFASGLQSFFN